MAGIYVDTSALGRVLLGEPDAGLIRKTLARYDPWWSSALLFVELRRLARREGIEEYGEELLSLLSTRRVDSPALKRAANLDPVEVRALDAIHLDAAIQLKARDRIAAVLTYDRQL
jgi:predicted nucleic acid-binding protein